MRYPIPATVKKRLSSYQLAEYAIRRLGAPGGLSTGVLAKQLAQIREAIGDRQGYILVSFLDVLANNPEAIQAEINRGAYQFYSPYSFIRKMEGLGTPQEIWILRYLERFCERQVELTYLRHWTDRLEDLLRAEEQDYPVSSSDIREARRKLAFVKEGMERREDEGRLTVTNLRLRTPRRTAGA